MNAQRLYTIRPPEYFPGLPFWAIAIRCDHVFIADTFQYSRQSFQNRARLRTPDAWQWITVPLKGRQHGRPIAKVEIDNTVPWRGKHFRALMYNYRSTPYFEAFEDRFEEFYSRDWRLLGDVTVASVQLLARLLEIPEPALTSSRNQPEVDGREMILAADRVVEGAYVQKFVEKPYRQNFPGFEPGMSLLDLFFNHGPESLPLLLGME